MVAKTDMIFVLSIIGCFARESQAVENIESDAAILKVLTPCKSRRYENKLFGQSLLHLFVFQKRNYQVFWSSFGFLNQLYILIARGYRPWSVAITAMDICGLVENGNQSTERKCKVCSNFFCQSIVCRNANIWSLTSRQPPSPDVYQNTISSTTRR